MRSHRFLLALLGVPALAGVLLVIATILLYNVAHANPDSIIGLQSVALGIILELVISSILAGRLRRTDRDLARGLRWGVALTVPLALVGLAILGTLWSLAAYD